MRNTNRTFLLWAIIVALESTSSYAMASNPVLADYISKPDPSYQWEKEYPDLDWKFDRQSTSISLSISTNEAPTSVNIWLATSETRDFRESKWTAKILTRNDKSFTYELQVPKTGFAALFGEAIYDRGGVPFFLSTNVQIVGEKRPAK